MRFRMGRYSSLSFISSDKKPSTPKQMCIYGSALLVSIFFRSLQSSSLLVLQTQPRRDCKFNFLNLVLVPVECHSQMTSLHVCDETRRSLSFSPSGFVSWTSFGQFISTFAFQWWALAFLYHFGQVELCSWLRCHLKTVPLFPFAGAIVRFEMLFCDITTISCNSSQESEETTPSTPEKIIETCRSSMLIRPSIFVCMPCSAVYFLRAWGALPLSSIYAYVLINN